MANHLSESEPEQTFQYQSSLPPLPVPTLESSLSKYLDAGRIKCHTFVTICKANLVGVHLVCTIIASLLLF